MSRSLGFPRFYFTKTKDGSEYLAIPTQAYLERLRRTYSVNELTWLASLDNFPESVLDNAKVRGWDWFTLDDYRLLRVLSGLSAD